MKSKRYTCLADFTSQENSASCDGEECTGISYYNPARCVIFMSAMPEWKFVPVALHSFRAVQSRAALRIMCGLPLVSVCGSSCTVVSRE